MEIRASSLKGRRQEFDLGPLGTCQPIAEQFLKSGPAHGPGRQRLQPITAAGGSLLTVAQTLEC